MAPTKILLLPLWLLSLLQNAQASQSIALGSSLSPTSPGNSWPSPSGRFAFGFYQYGRGFAVGIWLVHDGYGPTQNITVWTAYRDDPPVSPGATINFTIGGKLILENGRGETKAIADIPTAASAASMRDSGNFVLLDNKSTVIWESFDQPTDTILGGQKLPVNSKLVSRASQSDHSSGRFYLIMQSDENLVAYPVNRTTISSAYWASDTYQGIASERRSDIFLYLDDHTGLLSLSYSNATKRSLTQSSKQTPDNETTVVYRARFGPDGNFVLYSHRFGADGKIKVLEEWSALGSVYCENKAYCGLNSYCSKDGSLGNCTCLPGFLPQFNVPDCYLNFLDEDSCQGEDSKLSYIMIAQENIKWGGQAYSKFYVSFEDCHQKCLEDCNCWGALFDNGTCQMYKLPIMYAVLNPETSITAFVKSSSPVNPFIPKRTKIMVESKKATVLILASLLGSFAILCSFLAIIGIFMYKQGAKRYHTLPGSAHQALNGEFTLLSFSYDELEKATDGFKEIVGRNAYGAVYKGNLSENNKSIAVKTLENVEEGDSKFRTEITAVGRTHHKNLVRLLGFCIEGPRKLLVYEFMNNGSLANYLFKTDNQPPWKERVRIALDVARGILYLHEECESCIIHCNIKPQNILLSDSWTAKISDFGLAKLLMTNQSGTFTGAKGTKGYMAPEWEKGALLTEKADVYSFGVVLLEIICCKSTKVDDIPTGGVPLRFDWVYHCFSTNDLKNLVGDEEVDMKVLERMVKVGLLCVQDDAKLRPAMKNVILMLEGTVDIPAPRPLVASCS
ncbi:Serine/threonine protein kinase [Handroanthus impetiginosus]|uniref:Receptor-like serine/threonine-protein kinase n=1 Tax=Handroanthus impetiginosus TaxID=429701 RepID=A0A2G9H5E2_9LAMI|nr:Serine/threonine protein kinase [Handroanthus impetiginosus]